MHLKAVIGMFISARWAKDTSSVTWHACPVTPSPQGEGSVYLPTRWSISHMTPSNRIVWCTKNRVWAKPTSGLPPSSRKGIGGGRGGEREMLWSKRFYNCWINCKLWCFMYINIVCREFWSEIHTEAWTRNVCGHCPPRNICRHCPPRNVSGHCPPNLFFEKLHNCTQLQSFSEGFMRAGSILRKP